VVLLALALLVFCCLAALAHLGFVSGVTVVVFPAVDVDVFLVIVNAVVEPFTIEHRSGIIGSG